MVHGASYIMNKEGLKVENLATYSDPQKDLEVFSSMSCCYKIDTI